MLAALGDCEPQLAGHVAGNLTLCNARRVLGDIVTQMLRVLGYRRGLNAPRVVADNAPMKRRSH